MGNNLSPRLEAALSSSTTYPSDEQALPVASAMAKSPTMATMGPHFKSHFRALRHTSAISPTTIIGVQKMDIDAVSVPMDYMIAVTARGSNPPGATRMDTNKYWLQKDFPIARLTEDIAFPATIEENTPPRFSVEPQEDYIITTPAEGTSVFDVTAAF